MAKRRSRAEEHEEHVNHERWLVTYADMITLLMVLFIVMFAISQVDERKFEALKSGLSAGFGQENVVLVGATGTMTTSGSAPVLSDEQARVEASVQEAVTRAAQLRNGRVHADAEAEASRLNAIRRAIERAVERQGLERDVSIDIDERGLVVSLVSRHIIFRNDLATLTERGRAVVDAMAPVLSRLPDELEIAGHTNQVPVQPKYYASDWDLASARAVTVLRRLTERHGVAMDRVRATSYGNTMPLINPARPTSQRMNKRVDIVVLTQLTGEARDLLADAAEQEPTAAPDDEQADARDTAHDTTEHDSDDQSHAAHAPTADIAE